jgi:hypothetical protein
MENNNHELLLVLDIDETLLHYTDEPLPYKPDFEPVFEENDNDQLFLRPGLKKFLEYVKSTNGKIKLGIWTFGNAKYANALFPLLNFCLRDDTEKQADKCNAVIEFLYTDETLPDRTIPKNLSYVVENYLGMKYDTSKGLPKNIFLVDNRPENVSNVMNIRNAIMVESYLGKNADDNMFVYLTGFCKKFLESGGKVPRRLVQNFVVDGVMKKIMSIGKDFDDGLKPVYIEKIKRSSRGTSTISKSAKTIRKSVKTIRRSPKVVHTGGSKKKTRKQQRQNKRL